MRDPMAGLVKGSANSSSSAMLVPPIARFSDGKIKNWSPVASGTVLREMSWAYDEAGHSSRVERYKTRQPYDVECIVTSLI